MRARRDGEHNVCEISPKIAGEECLGCWIQLYLHRQFIDVT